MITRRNLLTALAGCGALGTAAWHFCYLPGLSGFRLPGGRSVFFDQGVGAQLLDLLDTLPVTDRVGRAWLEAFPEYPELPDLMNQFTGRLDLASGPLEGAIARQVREDFAAGNVCLVDGWRLSMTECQLSGIRQLAIEAGALRAAPEAAHSAIDYSVGEIAPVVDWGPKSTVQGVPFNQQLDGHSGLWFKISGAPTHARIMIDGEVAKTSVKDRVMTSGLHGELQERILSTPGSYEIAVVDPVRRTKQVIGLFEVKSELSATGQEDAQNQQFCEVTKWGPRQTRPGVAVNEQPDGSMGIWVHSDCLPAGARVLFGEDVLHHQRRKFGFTTSIPLALLGAPGRVPLSLYQPATGQRMVFGHLVIE